MTTKKKIRSPKREAANNNAVSVSPSGEAFKIPGPDDYEKEYARIRTLVARQRSGAS